MVANDLREHGLQAVPPPSSTPVPVAQAPLQRAQALNSNGNGNVNENNDDDDDVNDMRGMPGGLARAHAPQTAPQQPPTVPQATVGSAEQGNNTPGLGADPLLEESLQEAAMSIPDADAMSISSLNTTSTDRAADEAAEETAASSEDGRHGEPHSLATVDTSQDTRHQMDWEHFLGLSGQAFNGATTATSIGFAAARSTTAFGLNVAKRFTQGLVALPAIAIDGAVLGNTPSRSNYTGERGGPGSRTPTVAEVTHAAVGGLFDVISSLAIGGIDLGSAITGAGLGAAASGVEGLRRALGSEVLRSLGSFSRLVRREWSSASEFMPPGGIPGYSVLGVTQALTAWVSIQMVTREWYESNMLRHLEPIDLVKLENERVDKEQQTQEPSEAQTSQPVAEVPSPQLVAPSPPSIASDAPSRKHSKKRVRIIEGELLPGDEGQVIGAEIGQPEVQSEIVSDPATLVTKENDSAKGEEHVDARSEGSRAAQPLSTLEAVQGFKRYSRLVLGVYGGVALAWLGSLPPDLMQAAGTTVDQTQQQSDLPTPNTGSSAQRQNMLFNRRTGNRSAAEDDQADFLQAAATLDLDADELIEDEAASEASDDMVFVNAADAQSAPNTPPASATPRPVPSSDNILFSADTDGERTPPAAPSAPQVSRVEAAGRSYSYYDVLMGTADADIFHRLGGLEHGTAREGSYSETREEDTVAERLRRVQNRVARPSKPRYYVVTDHTQRKIVLVLRGSLVLGDIAIDLTCESANFDMDGLTPHEPAEEAADNDDEESDGPQPAEDFSGEAQREEQKASAARERESQPQARTHGRSEAIVHEGMYETAKEIGDVGRPVHRAVQRALAAYPDYDLDITGHSLGAGVASLLAIMWASPETGRTTRRSGLPPGRRTHAYSFAVPCVMGAKLARRAAPLVTSYCYSYDLVCRLSLGAILDIRNACAWLAYENNQPAQSSAAAPQSSSSTTLSTSASPQSQHYGLNRPLRLTNIMQRAFVHQSGQLDSHPQQKADLEADFLALRKTLEANMRHVELYPPGSVLYSLARDDVLPHLQAPRSSASDSAASTSTNTNSNDALARTATLYRLRDDGEEHADGRTAVFGQIIHARGMLSRHMPHLYHYAIEAL